MGCFLLLFGGYGGRGGGGGEKTLDEGRRQEHRN